MLGSRSSSDPLTDTPADTLLQAGTWQNRLSSLYVNNRQHKDAAADADSAAANLLEMDFSSQPSNRFILVRLLHGVVQPLQLLAKKWNAEHLTCLSEENT